MKKSLKLVICALAAALLMAGAGIAFAGTATQNITLTGAIAPPPATCSFGATANLNFTGQLTLEDDLIQADSAVLVTCAVGTAYSLKSPTRWNAVTVGGAPAGVIMFNPKTDIDMTSTPISGTGTGSAQSIPVQGLLGGAQLYSAPDPTTNIGAVGGVVPLTLTF